MESLIKTLALLRTGKYSGFPHSPKTGFDVLQSRDTVLRVIFLLKPLLDILHSGVAFPTCVLVLYCVAVAIACAVVVQPFTQVLVGED